jgi:hypothetical protein
MQEPDPAAPSFPAEPLEYRSADPSTGGVMRVLAWVGIAVGVARVLDASVAISSYWRLWGSPPIGSRWYRSFEAAMIAGLLIVGGLLISGCIGLLKRRDWAISLIRFSEIGALALYALEVVAGLASVGVAGPRAADQLLLVLTYTFRNTVEHMTYPILALTLIRWYNRHAAGG